MVAELEAVAVDIFVQAGDADNGVLNVVAVMVSPLAQGIYH